MELCVCVGKANCPLSAASHSTIVVVLVVPKVVAVMEIYASALVPSVQGKFVGSVID
jgi:hypothetical protein